VLIRDLYDSHQSDADKLWKQLDHKSGTVCRSDNQTFIQMVIVEICIWPLRPTSVWIPLNFTLEIILLTYYQYLCYNYYFAQKQTAASLRNS